MQTAVTSLREFAAPESYAVPEDTSLARIVTDLAVSSPDLVVFQVPGRRDITAAKFAEEVAAVAKGLIASGIQMGDRVAIMSATRYEWSLLDYAIWSVGGITVAIYESSATEQARWILADSETKLLVVETAAHFATVAAIPAAELNLDETLRIDTGAIDELVRRGADLGDDVLAERRVKSTAPATLIYTSGTTGRPKGVQLTHANLLAESAVVRNALSASFAAGRRTLLFLPLAHIFARAISVGALEAGVAVTHTSDWTTLVDQFAECRPDFILSVPRVFEKVYNSAKQKAHDGGAVKGAIFDRAATTAIAWSEAQETGGPGLALRVQHAVFDRLVYAKLRAALGGQCERAVSGGGPLGARLGHFFNGVGLPVYEGYGLTETSAAVSVNSMTHFRVGTVGRPLPGHTVRIADDGELLVQGPVVFQGYWNNDVANADSFDGEWFKTGDLASIDADGYITITGRKKELIVTAAGKNVSPALLEDSLRAHPLISQCMAVGDAKPFIGALITLDPEAMPGWLERNSLDRGTPLTELVRHPALLAELEAAVAETNAKVSKAEGIKKFRVLPVDWTQETGELTPKLSLKRAVVMEKYGSEVEALYR